MARKVNCPFSERAQHLLDGRLPAEPEREFLLHAEVCPGCREELKRLKAVRELLHEAAGAAPPACDDEALRAAVLGAPPARPARWRIPALAAAAVSAALVAILLRPAPAPRSPAPPAQSPPASPSAPSSASPRQILISFAPMPLLPAPDSERTPAIPFGRIEAPANGPLALRPSGEIALLLWPGAATTLSERPGSGIEIDLHAGECSVRRGPKAEGLRVCASGHCFDAVGTTFHLALDAQGALSLDLLEGALEPLDDRSDRAARLIAPAGVDLAPGRRVERAPSEHAREALRRSDALDPFRPGALGWLALDSAPAGAEVWDGETMLGHAPLLLARSEGEWPLQLRREGWRDAQIRLRVEAGRLLRHRASLEPQPESTPARPQSAMDVSSRARALLAAHKVDSAIALLESRLRSHPGDIELRLLLADALRLGRRPEQALEHYRQVARQSRNPHVLEVALFEASRIELDVLNQPARALETLLAARRILPQGLLRQEVAFRLAECYLKLSDFGRAARALQDYLRLYPQGTRAEEARRLLDDLAQKGWR